MPLFPPNLAAGGAPTRKMGRPTIYHYPRSKSSYGAIRLLEACSLKPIIIDITVDPLLPRDVERFMAELGIDDPRDFMRTSDPLYAELNLHDPALGRDALIQAIIDHPRLMRRPIVELPFREQGQRRRALVIAQPPQKLFGVIFNESEEEALGLATPRPLEETEADRWARQWSQAEGQFQIDPEQVAQMRAQLADTDESFEFPEETDEIGEDDELPFAIDDDVEAAVSDDIDEAELHRFLREEGLDDEIIIDHTTTDDNAVDEAGETPDAAADHHHRQKQQRRRNDDADPEFAAKVNAIILEMAKKAVEEEEREPHKKQKQRGNKPGQPHVTAEEMTELLERIMEVAPPPPRQRPGRRRLPIPPAPAASSEQE